MKKTLYLLFAFFLFIQIGKAQDTTLWVTIDVTHASGPAVCDGSLSAEVYGGVPPYAYLWTPTAYTQTISGLCPGVYTLVVTDSEGNAFTATAEVLGGSADVYGCMDPMALNYNALATIDDGSCVYDSIPGGDSTYIFGCTDPYALNYNPYATINDGSCFYDSTGTSDVYGCTDPDALNYNPYATVSDGNCIYDYTEVVVDSCFGDIDSAWISSYELIDSSMMIVTWDLYIDGTWETYTVTYFVEADGMTYVLLIINCDEAKSTQQTLLDVVEVDYSTLTGIGSVTNQNPLIYPNPTDGVLNISVPNNEENVSIQLLNTTGQVCWSGNANSGSNIVISPEAKLQGLYFVKISDSKQTKTYKVIFR